MHHRSDLEQEQLDEEAQQTVDQALRGALHFIQESLRQAEEMEKADQRWTLVFEARLTFTRCL